MSHIHMSHPYGETPKNVFSDFDWVHLHEKELLEKYGECSIIVYKGQVLGTGATYDEAVADAEKNPSPEMGDVTPVHRKIYYRRPIFSIRRRVSSPY